MSSPGRSSITKKTMSGFGWLTSSTIVTSITRLISVMVLSRLLMPDEFAVMAAAGIFIEFATLASKGGILQTIVQRPELNDRQINTAFTANFVLAVLCSAILCLASLPIAEFFSMPVLAPVLWACSLLFPLRAVSGISNKLLERSHDFKALAQRDAISMTVALLGVGIPLAFLGFGVWALVIPQLVYAALRSIIVYRACRHPIKFSFHLASYLDLMRDGSGYGLQRICNFVAQKGDYFVVGRLLGASALGLYERAYVLMNLSNSFVMNTVGTILFPAFYRLNGQTERIRTAFARCSSLLALMFIPVSCLCIVLAPELVDVLLGNRWEEAVLPFQILAAAMYPRTAYKLAGVVTNSLAQVFRGTVSQLIYACAVVGGSFFGAQFGIVGVAWAGFGAIWAVHILRTWAVLAAIEMPVSRYLQTLLPALVFSAIMLAAAYGVILPLRVEGMSSFISLPAAAGAAGLATVVLVFAVPRLITDDILVLLRPPMTKLCARLDQRKLPSGWLRRLLREKETRPEQP